MITLVPSLMILSKQYKEKRKDKTNACSDCVDLIQRVTQPIVKNIFSKIIPNLVTKLSYVWLILLTGLTIAGLVIIFYKPKLELPAGEVVPVFRKSTLVKIYDTTLKHEYRFTETRFQKDLDVNTVFKESIYVKVTLRASL